MSNCGECRFMTLKGCRAGVCQEVRTEMRAQGMKPVFRPLIQLRPEPPTPSGLCGHQLEYAGRRLEYPPTQEGQQAARARVEYLATIGVDAKWTELRRDAETQRFLKSVNL